MKNNELMDKIRRKLDKCDGQTKASHGISELLCKMDTALEMLKGIVVHGKEATDEYNDFPSDSNRIVMELARQNVVHAAQGLADLLTSEYDGLTKRAKEILSFREFGRIVQERLTNILKEEN